MTLQEGAEIAEARLLIRWAARILNDTERRALAEWLADVPAHETARALSVTGGAIWMARKEAIGKLRRRLRVLGIRSAAQVCSRCA